MAVTAHPFTGSFMADRNHSSINFAVRHMQVSTFRGSFAGLEARLVGDEAGLGVDGTVRVELISITYPPELREHVVRGADFFAGDEHPEIRFRSDRVELAADGSARVEGLLTMKGVSRKVVATGSYQSPVQDPFGAMRGAIELRAAIDRRDWGFTWQMPLPDGRDGLGWTVEVTVQLELVKEQ